MAFTQTLDDVVSNAYLLSTGKSGGLVFGTTKYTKLVALANLYQGQWARERGVDWRSLRSIFTVAAVVTATDTFTLPVTIGEVSRSEGDFVRILHADGTSETDYNIVPIERLYDNGPQRNNDAPIQCAVSGASLVFNRAFTSASPQLGGSIKVPGYAIPTTLVSSSDTVQVDDPTWLSTRMAAEYVRTDLTRQDQYPNLISASNELMEAMKELNDVQIETISTPWEPFTGDTGAWA